MPDTRKPDNSINQQQSTNTTQTSQGVDQTSQIRSNTSGTLNKIVRQKRKWEKGLPQGFESGPRYTETLKNVLAGNETQTGELLSRMTRQLGMEFSGKIERFGFPTQDCNYKEYKEGDLRALYRFETETNNGDETTRNLDIDAKSQIRAAMTLGILLQAPMSKLKQLREELCEGNNQDRESALMQLRERVEDSLQRVETFDRESSQYVKLQSQRPSLTLARDIDRHINRREVGFQSTVFTDPKEFSEKRISFAGAYVSADGRRQAAHHRSEHNENQTKLDQQLTNHFDIGDQPERRHRLGADRIIARDSAPTSAHLQSY